MSKTRRQLMDVAWTRQRFSYYESVVPHGWDRHIRKEIGSALCERYLDRYEGVIISISYLRRKEPNEDLDTLDEALFPKWAFERERRQWRGEEEVLPQFPRGTASFGGIYIFQSWPTHRRPARPNSIEKVCCADELGILITTEAEALGQLEFRDWFRDLTSPKIHIGLGITGLHASDELSKWKDFFARVILSKTRFV